jgi:hypothetical protein
LGAADWRYEFVRGGAAATHKFIPGLSNAEDCYTLEEQESHQSLKSTVLLTFVLLTFFF